MTRQNGNEFENGTATIVATPDENSLAALFDAKFKIKKWDVFVQKKGEARYEGRHGKVSAQIVVSLRWEQQSQL